MEANSQKPEAMSLDAQIKYCQQKMSEGIDFDMYEAIRDTLAMAEKFNLFPPEVDGKVFKSFVGAYFDFRRSRGAEPKMTPLAGKSLKEIIRYLLKNDKVNGDGEKALVAWKFILDKWDHLSDFIRTQVTLQQINKNIEEIIEQLTNATQKAKQRHHQSEKDRLRESLKKR